MNPYALLFGVLVVLLFTALVAFELLLCRLYRNNRAEWTRLGSPVNLCNLRIAGFVSGSWARWCISRTLLLTRPSWIESDKVLQMSYLTFRWSATIYLLGSFGFVVIALLLS